MTLKNFFIWTTLTLLLYFSVSSSLVLGPLMCGSPRRHNLCSLSSVTFTVWLDVPHWNPSYSPSRPFFLPSSILIPTVSSVSKVVLSSDLSAVLPSVLPGPVSWCVSYVSRRRDRGRRALHSTGCVSVLEPSELESSVPEEEHFTPSGRGVFTTPCLFNKGFVEGLRHNCRWQLIL